jgi:hypothetical protein
MKLRTAIGTVLGTLVLVASLSPRFAYADNTTCTGLLTGFHDNVVVPSGADCILSGAQVRNNVRVMQDASLLATVGPLGPTVIGGNVHGIHSRFVLLVFATQVGGNFHVHGGDVGTTSGFDIGVTIGGNATIELNAGRTFVDAATVGGQLNVWRNTGGCIEVEFNTVGGHVRVEDNIIPPTPCAPPPVGGATVVAGMSVLGNNVLTGHMMVLRNSGDGPKQVVSNIVARRLVCRDNDEPFIGAPNVAGSAEGQCGVP